MNIRILSICVLHLKKMLYIYLFFGIFINSQGLNSAENLKHISQEDKVILKDFFQSLFAEGDFAHTLFGSKPMAFIDYRIELKFLQSDEYPRKKAVIAMRGWDTWKKYQHLFQMENFYLVSTKAFNNSFSIALVSKKNVLNLIKDNLSLFQESLGLEDTVSIIFDKILHQWVFSSVFDKKKIPKHYSKCIGILLGYGKANSEAFEERDTYKCLLATAPLNPRLFENEKLMKTVRGMGNYPHLPNQTYTIQAHSLIAKLNLLEQNYGYIQATFKNNFLCPVRSPRFMSIKNNPETNIIKKNYDQFCEELVKIYYSEKFLEIILDRLGSVD